MSTATKTTDASLSDSAIEDAARVPGFGIDVNATLEWCVDIGRRAPAVGEGRTRELWDLLAAVAEVDVSAARTLEPCTSTRSASFVRPAWVSVRGATGSSVWARGRTLRGRLRRGDARHDSGSPSRRRRLVFRGAKPWCSLAGHLTHALVTASVDGTIPRMFAVDLRSSGVRAQGGPWFARGLRDVASAPVDFDRVPAVPVGGAGWYLSRAGFAWGGMSVAACWWGAAVGVAAPLLTAARSQRADQISLVHLGRTDAALWAARAVLHQAADAVDSGESAAIGDRLLGQRVRGVVSTAAELVLTETDAALGPAPLVTDDAHSRRVADLHLYLRQHHGLRDAARIGRELVVSA